MRWVAISWLRRLCSPHGPEARCLAAVEVAEWSTGLAVVINEERPDMPDAVALIDELETHLASLYPRESRHGYSVDKLLRERVAFFVTREDGRAAGCGGVLVIEGAYAEIKRMYVRPAFRGRGLGRLMLDHLIAYAGRQGLTVIRLETGIYQQEAIALYEGSGFRDRKSV